MLRFRIRGAIWSLQFSTEVAAQLASFAQRGWRSREAVGQLYSSDLTAEPIRVDRVTRLTPSWAGYSGVKLNIASVNHERHEMHKQGFHCLGFWHSHPESRPKPSHEDVQMAAAHARASKREFEGLVFAIVGTDPFPLGLGIWVHDGDAMWRAEHEVREVSHEMLKQK